MIDDLDATLEALLARQLPPNVHISFLTPDEGFPNAVEHPAVNLFLYDVRENRELRCNGWRTGHDEAGHPIREAPAVRLDCSYLVTAWPAQTALKEEHLLLGKAIQALLRYPTVPAPILRGELARAGVEPPANVLQPGHLQGVAELWQALGGRPRAAFNYTVTIAVQPAAPTQTAPEVREKVLDFHVAAGPTPPERRA